MKDKTKLRKNCVTGRFTKSELEQFNELRYFWNISIAETVRRCLLVAHEIYTKELKSN
jgi:hypothetical protein